MKKFLALVLALTLVLGLATVVGATSNTYTNGVLQQGEENFDGTNGATSTGTVRIEVQATTPSPLYYVVVEWDDLTFQYSFGNESPVWDPEYHTYSPNQAVGWGAKVSAEIKVTNHSNHAVKVSALFDNDQTSKTVNEVKATLGNSTFDLETADQAQYHNTTDAPTDTITVQIDNTTVPNTNLGFNLGTVTVSITPAP